MGSYEICPLPIEILSEVFRLVEDDFTLSVYQKLKIFKNSRLVCNLFNNIVTPLMYNNIPFKGPHSFASFLDEIREFPDRGRCVRNLDFSAFTSVGLGRSRSCNTKILMLTADKLKECIELCPNVCELFMSEALEDDIDVNLMRSIFDLKKLRALDFCAADSATFVQSCLALKAQQDSVGPWSSTVKNLSFHNCSTLPMDFFGDFLSHFPRLERLDLYNTLVTGQGLMQLPASCRLASLNLSQCTKLTAPDILTFILTHPGCKTLVDLKLLYNWNKTHPLSDHPQQLDILLQGLPRHLKVLDLAGIELDSAHLQMLPPHLIELGAHDIDLSTRDQTPSFPPPSPHPSLPFSSTSTSPESASPSSPLHALRYLLLTHNVISNVPRFASALLHTFPRLSLLESPGFARLHLVAPSVWTSVEGTGRRDWFWRRGTAWDGVEECKAHAWHPRKTNMSLSGGVPRGLYEYYSYRV